MWVVTTNGVAINLDHCPSVRIRSGPYGFELCAEAERAGGSDVIETFKNEETAVECFYALMKALNRGDRSVDVRVLLNPNANTANNLPLRGLV